MKPYIGAMTTPLPDFATVKDDFAFIDDWDEKYAYLIDLGRNLSALPDAAHTEENKVRGCASQVWLTFTQGDDGRLLIQGDSDAAIVKGLVALMIILFSGKTAAEMQAIDAEACLAELDLRDHITPQRSNGVASMITRIKAVAAAKAI